MRGTLTFPITNIKGEFETLKFHKKYQTEGIANQLYPWMAVFHNPCPYVVIVEGEMDMYITRQMGFNSVTQILGANAWHRSFSEYFRKKTVYLAYDNDAPGGEAAMSIATQHLWPLGIPTYIIQWPSFMQEKEDHIEFFVKYKKTAQDYKILLGESKSVMSLTRGR